jgi:hypothetical protein
MVMNIGRRGALCHKGIGRGRQKDLLIYLHVPFCNSKCSSVIGYRRFRGGEKRAEHARICASALPANSVSALD